MPHAPEDKKRALVRVRRLRGQLEALERALEAGAECAPVLQQLAAIRGAVQGLTAQVLESHVRESFGGRVVTREQQDALVSDLTSLMRSYLK